MYFTDGPSTFKPPTNESFTADNLFSSPSGMPSVHVGSYPFSADETIKSLKSLHSQFSSAFRMMNLAEKFEEEASKNDPIVKCADKSIEFRTKGNKKYSVNNLDAAVRLYTKSIAIAFGGSVEQSLAFGNRSAALLRLGKLESCLHDINRALEIALCPQSSREKLEKRKADCLSAMKKKLGADATIDADATDPVNVRENDDDEEWRALCKFDNPLIPNASAKFKIMCDDVWGRHLVATEDIDPGEILSCQKFNALLLNEDQQKALTHCTYCLSECLALIPCRTCNECMYCSNYCRSRAYESYHRVECKIMYKANSTYKLRVMRMLIEGTEQGARVPELMSQLGDPREVMKQNTDPSNKPFVNDYVAVLRMSRTFNSDLSSNFYTFVSDLIRGLRTVGLCGSFRSEMEPKLTKAEVFVGMLTFNHATTARSHSFAIQPAHVSTCAGESMVGIGICALHSMVNHSCDPNVGFFTRNRQHVLVASKPIKKGEQLFHCYWEPYQWRPQKQRKEMLSMFFGFTCQCIACTNGWPQEFKLSTQKIVLMDKDKAKARKEALKLLRPFVEGHISKLDNRQVIDALKEVCKWMYANVKHPSILFMKCEFKLEQFISLTYDNLAEKVTREGIRENIGSTFEGIHNAFLFMKVTS